MRLDHTYHGPAHPFELGRNVDFSQPPETISGAFRTSDFQDGLGMTLSNGEQPEKHWVVRRKHWRNVKFVGKGAA